MKKYLGQYASKHISVSFHTGSCLYGFRNRTAQAPACSRELCQYLAPHLGGIRRRWRHLCTIGTHYFPAERFLFIRNFYHVHPAVQIEIGTRHGKGCPPLPCPSLRCYPF
ncbi:hypothetical protein IMSAGC021_00227 [Muribaculaceae bacterium]|nr:hypothetical protein IMSAGC021_00227 [Muribaculaceae bacterium]